MTTDWLPGILRLDSHAEDGGAQDTDYPPRLVLHTTEGGGTVQDLAAYYVHSTFWPHFTADPVRHVLAQHLPLSRAGRALSHTDATETNRAHCIQVEIIGYAKDSAQWKTDDVRWLGKALAPVLDALGIHRSGPKFVAGGAGLHAVQRMSEEQWRAFNGICGHEHVPENDHYDPGALDLAAFIVGSQHQAAVEPDMHLVLTSPIVSYLRVEGKGAWLALEDGGIITLEGHFYGTPVGHAYWHGHKAASLRVNPMAQHRDAHPYVVVDSDGHTYGLDGFD